MLVSRRNFISKIALCAPAVLLGDRALAAAPLIVNYNHGGGPTITEGKTLLVSIRFPFRAEYVEGSLPVEIAPASAGGASLIEPQPLYFNSAGDGETFSTVLCAPLDAVEGKGVVLKVRAGRRRTSAAEYSFVYRIRRGDYRSSHLSLSQGFSSPSPEVAGRMRRDFETMVEIYKRRTPRRWKSSFTPPVVCAHRNNFGDRRTVNGTKRYRHAGLDYNAPMGTPVRAMNGGVVVLSAEQWTPGQTVCIDHGGGVFSKYMHLSERRVRTGDVVKRGDIIALSGRSGGQKPGPHLHVDMVVNGAHVHPLDFMQTAAQLISLEGGAQF